MKKFIICLTFLILGLSLVGCEAKAKDFSILDMTITLDDSFVESSQVGVNLALVSKKYVVAITTNNQVPSYSLSSFAEIIDENFAVDLNFEEAKTTSDVEFLYAMYDNTGGNSVEYSYLSAIYKNNGVFYVVDLCCEKKFKTDEIMAQFLSWAKTVVFK